MNKNEKQSARMLEEIIQYIKDGSISVMSIEIEHDVEKFTIPGTTIISPEYTGNHTLIVRWTDRVEQQGESCGCWDSEDGKAHMICNKHAGI